MIITGKTKLLGVIGDPIKHSLSPVMHNAAINKLGVDYIYVPFPIKQENLETALAGFKTIGVLGFNITIPHKQTIIPFLSCISDTAKLVGAVNTVWQTETGWNGTNTDVEGFLSPLKTCVIQWSGVTPIILGNGGAARAVVVGCYQLGCREIYVIGRDENKLNTFSQSWLNTPIAEVLKVHLWEDLAQLISKTPLLINTTPLGMFPNIEQSPVELTVMEKLQPGAFVYDLIYNPSPTLFLKQAKQQGANIIDGLEMLVQQGAKALSIWLNREDIPVEVMGQSLREYLKL